MASRQVRNLINNQIDSVVARAETEVRNEAKKKLIELKQKVSDIIFICIGAIGIIGILVGFVKILSLGG